MIKITEKVHAKRSLPRAFWNALLVQFWKSPEAVPWSLLVGIEDHPEVTDLALSAIQELKEHGEITSEPLKQKLISEVGREFGPLSPGVTGPPRSECVRGTLSESSP